MTAVKKVSRAHFIFFVNSLHRGGGNDAYIRQPTSNPQKNLPLTFLKGQAYLIRGSSCCCNSSQQKRNTFQALILTLLAFRQLYLNTVKVSCKYSK